MAVEAWLERFSLSLTAKFTNKSGKIDFIFNILAGAEGGEKSVMHSLIGLGT